MEKKKINYFSRQILRRRAVILNKLAGLERDLEELQHNQPKDWAEVTYDMVERESITQKIDAEKNELRRLNASLRKMIAGKYGICSRCGRSIPEARLRALPMASLCIPCQLKEETSAYIAS